MSLATLKPDTSSPLSPSLDLRSAHETLAPLLRLGLVLGSVIVFVSYAVVAVAHINDTYRLTHEDGMVAGIYTGLAQHLNAGRLYPDVCDDAYFGGTRYMPLSFMLHAGLAKLTGEYLVSGKLLVYFFAAWLCVQLFLILKQQRCSTAVALAMPALVLASSPGYFACTTIRGDLLAVLLQLGAVALAARSSTNRALGWTAALCTLAILSKLSAIWAPAAIGLFLLVRNRRAFVVFAGFYAGMVALTLILLHVVSSGRMLENFLAVTSAEGRNLLALLRSPFRMLFFLSRGGTLFQVFVPFVVVEMVTAIRQRRCTPFHYAVVCCIPVLILIYSDMGTTSNHLVDAVVLAALLMGLFWSSLEKNAPSTAGLRVVFCIAVLWGLSTVWAANLAHPLADVVSAVHRGQPLTKYPAKPLADVIGDDETILTEDGWVAIARGQIPVMLDSYSLARMGHSHSDVIARMERRIRNHDFSKIVLFHKIDLDDPAVREWYSTFVGISVVEAIADSYRLEQAREGYFIYMPNARVGGRG